MTTEVQEFEFNAGDVDSVDQSTVEQSGPQYPVMQWHYGDAKAKKIGGMDYNGGWFVKDGQIDEATMLAAGWTKTTWTHDSGTEDDGFWRREIAASVIAIRKRWEVTAADGTKQLYPWSKYDTAKEQGAPRGRTHVLCVVKGLESIGPVVLTLKGSAAVGVEGNRNSAGALTKFAQTVIARANMESAAVAKKAGKAPGKWPYRAFWLPVGADREANGDPKFVEMGKGKETSRLVLPVALGLPAKAEQVELKRFYVGADLLATVNDLLAANTEWVSAWENITPGATENGATVVEPEAQPEPATASALTELGL
jgi:hypothetical protein